MKNILIMLFLVALLITPDKFIIGKCYKEINSNPFEEVFVFKILDKKNSYVKFTFFNNTDTFLSEPESFFNGVKLEETDCSGLHKYRYRYRY